MDDSKDERSSDNSRSNNDNHRRRTRSRQSPQPLVSRITNRLNMEDSLIMDSPIAVDDDDVVGAWQRDIAGGDAEGAVGGVYEG